jgi:hypothetical protein
LQQLGMVAQKLQHRLLDQDLDRHAADDRGQLELLVCRLGNAYAELGPRLRFLRGRQIGKGSGPNAFWRQIWTGFARHLGWRSLLASYHAI